MNFMAEVVSIMNSRPLIPVSSDPDQPMPLTLATLLTMKSTQETVEMYPVPCRPVMGSLEERILNYSPTSQEVAKDRENLKESDIVLLRDKTHHRNDWPVGVIVKATFENLLPRNHRANF